MKFLKKFAVLVLVLPLLFSLVSFKAPGSVAEPELVIIKIQELQTGGLGGSSHILVSEKGKIRVIDLEKFGTVANNTRNLEVISNLLNQYYKDGYKIENSSSISSPAGFGVTTYVLTK